MSVKAHCLVDPLAAAAPSAAGLLTGARLWPARPLQLRHRWEPSLSLSACAVLATAQLACASLCPYRGCDEACRPQAFVAGNSAVMAHDLPQVAGNQAETFVGRPQTGVLTQCACCAAVAKDTFNMGRARELEQVAVKAMRAYGQ